MCLVFALLCLAWCCSVAFRGGILHALNDVSVSPGRLFDYTDCPEGPVLPGAHSIERYLIEEHLHNIIKEYHLERKQW